jgi:CheY-like chemotaxis protein
VTLDGTRVLVVEDDALISLMIEDFLADLGCQVAASCARLEDGLAKAGNLAFDAAVLDINLGGQLSYPIAELLGARNIPYIFATGYGLAGLPPPFSRVPVLSKPFGLLQLKDGLGRALDQHVASVGSRTP